VTTTCDQPLSFAHFVDYFFGDLPPQQEQSLEAHLFECAACAERAEVWGNDTLALRARATELPRSALTRAELVALGDRAVVIDVPKAPQFDVRLGDTAIHVFHVNLAPEVLRALDRLDVEYVKAEVPDPIFHVSSVPFEPQTGDVYLACHEQVLRSHGDTTMRLVGTQRGEARTLFETEIHFV
jgi:hypothetical protein